MLSSFSFNAYDSFLPLLRAFVYFRSPVRYDRHHRLLPHLQRHIRGGRSLPKTGFGRGLSHYIQENHMYLLCVIV